MPEKKVRDEERARFVKAWLDKNPNGSLKQLREEFPKDTRFEGFGNSFDSMRRRHRNKKMKTAIALKKTPSKTGKRKYVRMVDIVRDWVRNNPSGRWVDFCETHNGCRSAYFYKVKKALEATEGPFITIAPTPVKPAPINPYKQIVESAADAIALLSFDPKIKDAVVALDGIVQIANAIYADRLIMTKSIERIIKGKMTITMMKDSLASIIDHNINRSTIDTGMRLAEVGANLSKILNT